MKKTIIALSLILAAFSLNAQETVSEIKTVRADYDNGVIPGAFMACNGKAAVTFGMEIPGDLLKYNQCIVAAPVIVNGDSCEVFPPVLIARHHYSVVATDKENLNGKAYPDYCGFIAYKNEPVSYHYQQEIAVRPWMRGGVIKLVAKKYSTKWNRDNAAADFRSSVEGGACACAMNGGDLISENGIVDYWPFVKKAQKIYYSNKLVQKTFVEEFDNESVFKVDKYTASEADLVEGGYGRLQDFCERMNEKGLCRIVALDVHASASPEGDLKHNAMLAEKRARNVHDYVASHLKMDPAKIRYTWDDENWADFAKIVPTFANADEIQKIIDGNSDLEVRERKLKRLKNWPAILDAFNSLRNCRVTIDYKIYEGEDPDAPYKMLKVLTDPQTLDIDACRQAYAAEENDRTANNLMVALMEEGRLEEAEKYAETIFDGDIDPYVANNKGVLFTLLGDYPYAESLFKKAEGVKGVKCNYGTDLLYMGRFAEAAEQFGDCSSNNSIVASLYAGDYNKAIAKFRSIAEPNAEQYYLGSIAYAAADYDALALKNLAKACEADASYKQDAASRAEFIKYREDSRFNEIIK